MMHRFILPPERCAERAVTLSPGDSHHAARVLRLSSGDAIEVLNGHGQRLSCRLVRIDKHGCVAEVISRHDQPRPVSVALAPAVLKSRAMDLLIQKATELGAVRISPLITSRCAVQMEPESSEKLEPWRRIAMEACKQCGNAWLPALDPCRSLKSYLAGLARGVRVAAMLAPDSRLPGMVLDVVSADEGLTLLTGPEGDFTPEEQQALRDAGAQPITLGPLVLRAETAAVAGLAVLQHEVAVRRMRSGAAHQPDRSDQSDDVR
jgi:16S rRNA (uracil1498-N3)-methyltransferase